jgi:hypothetical protein
MNKEEMKNYSKNYYANNKEYWVKRRESKEGLFLYFYKDLTSTHHKYAGSTKNMETRYAREINCKTEKIYKYFIKNQIPYAVYCINLLDIPDLYIQPTEKDLKQLEQYQINRYSCTLLNEVDAVKKEEYDFDLVRDLILHMKFTNTKWKLWKYEDFDRKEDDFMDYDRLPKEFSVDATEIFEIEGWVTKIMPDGSHYNVWQEEHI